MELVKIDFEFFMLSDNGFNRNYGDFTAFVMLRSDDAVKAACDELKEFCLKYKNASQITIKKAELISSSEFMLSVQS